MKHTLLLSVFVMLFCSVVCAQKAVVREYEKVFTTYPFSDPDPIPQMGKVYPYFRFDGYTNTPVQKKWKVVELENDHIRVTILPEVGGKIWSAIEKSTGKSFIYYNQTVKFRDVAMRGPWTSGGIEANYGIIGHTPNCATPVDYVVMEKPDGSVSCVIGVFDLLTRTSWRIDINLQKDKAFFTTGSFWYNASSIEQPYYTWMNTGLKSKGNLQFIYPGTKYLGHDGDYADWPIDKKNGKDISYYENNNFGEYKSYHVFGTYADFFGAYYHDEDFGMARYSNHDDKAGKKIWIWGLSEQGMIWEKLLTDNDGQYVEVQSGRMYNQAAEKSVRTPFKHTGFSPKTTDTWIEYWFPVLNTKGFVNANNFGSLNLKMENKKLKIYFSPVQQIADELVIKDGDKTIYSKTLRLKTLQLFSDSFDIAPPGKSLSVTLGNQKMVYEMFSKAEDLSRPVQSPANFDWSSAYGLYLQGKENIRQRFYAPAEEKLRASLKKEPDYIPALTELSMLLYRNMRYEEALEKAKRALSIDTYDPAANYYYGLINAKLGKVADAKDGFDIAVLGSEYRSASYTALAGIYFKEGQLIRAREYAQKSISFNKYAVDAWQLEAVMARALNDRNAANAILDTLLQFDPLSHFARFEQWLWQPGDNTRDHFISMIRNEMPVETFLELAIWYTHIGRKADALKLLALAPQNAEVTYWRAWLGNMELDNSSLRPDNVFPFRPETAEVIQELMKHNDHWLLKYHLALIRWNYNDLEGAKKLFGECGNVPDYAPFYAARAALNARNEDEFALEDLLKARALDNNQWRYGRSLVNYYFSTGRYDTALIFAKEYKMRFPDNFIVGMLYAKTLMYNKQYAAADVILKKIEVLPNEGSTEGRHIYKENTLMLALAAMKKKNYSKASAHVQAARRWPANLGVGKPYDEDIDERLEDWLAYEIAIRKGDNKESARLIDKILSASAKENSSRGSSSNDLVTAWALKAKGEGDKALNFLQETVKKRPDNAMAKWTLETYNGQSVSLQAGARADENYRILQALAADHNK